MASIAAASSGSAVRSTDEIADLPASAPMSRVEHVIWLEQNYAALTRHLQGMTPADLDAWMAAFKRAADASL